MVETTKLPLGGLGNASDVPDLDSINFGCEVLSGSGGLVVGFFSLCGLPACCPSAAQNLCVVSCSLLLQMNAISVSGWPAQSALVGRCWDFAFHTSRFQGMGTPVVRSNETQTPLLQSRGGAWMPIRASPVALSYANIVRWNAILRRHEAPVPRERAPGAVAP